MADGDLKGTVVPFHVIVPKKCNAELLTILTNLGLNEKKNLHVWTLG